MACAELPLKNTEGGGRVDNTKCGQEMRVNTMRRGQEMRVVCDAACDAAACDAAAGRCLLELGLQGVAVRDEAVDHLRPRAVKRLVPD